MSSITLGLFLFRTRNIFLDGLIIRNEGTDTKNFILQERVKCSTEKRAIFLSKTPVFRLIIKKWFTHGFIYHNSPENISEIPIRTYIHSPVNNIAQTTHNSRRFRKNRIHVFHGTTYLYITTYKKKNKSVNKIQNTTQSPLFVFFSLCYTFWRHSSTDCSVHSRPSISINVKFNKKSK